VDQSRCNPSVALTRAATKPIGGIENALSNHADEAFDELDRGTETHWRKSYSAPERSLHRQGGTPAVP